MVCELTKGAVSSLVILLHGICQCFICEVALVYRLMYGVGKGAGTSMCSIHEGEGWCQWNGLCVRKTKREIISRERG